MRRKLYFAKVTLRCRYAIFDRSHVLSRGDSEEKMSVQFYILEEKMFVILCQDEKGTHTDKFFFIFCMSKLLTITFQIFQFLL